MKRTLLLLAALALLAPALLAAVQGCVMVECGVAEQDPHACCAPAATRLVAACCDHDDEALDTTGVPASGADRRAGQPPVEAIATPVVESVVAAVSVAAPAEAASPPPRDLLARHCILRI